MIVNQREFTQIRVANNGDQHWLFVAVIDQIHCYIE